MLHRCHFVASLALSIAFSYAASPALSQDVAINFDAVKCDGDYQHHLQGVCTDNAGGIVWSFTTELVKTDRHGKILKKVPVATHHGDLCFRTGKIYVAVNLGRFNDPNGNADSWVYSYDADTLEFIDKFEVQEVFHGAGGIGTCKGHFFVVGGLPDGVEENYVYEYDAEFQFLRKHTIESKWTHLGIQTATFHDGAWWFGCYGSPAILLKTDPGFRLIGRHEFNCSLGIVGAGSNRLLFAKGPKNSAGRHLGSLHPARPDDKRGLVAVPVKTKTTSKPRERRPQGVAQGIEKPLLIAPRPENGRNSEGDFIHLKDGRILLAYTKFTGTSDHAPAEIVGRFSSDGGKTWTGDDVPIVARTESDANLMSVSLLRLANGQVALFYIQKYDSPSGSKYPYQNNILMRTSNDECKTWSAAAPVVPKEQPGYRVLNNDRVIQLESGRLVVPLAVHYQPGWPGFQRSADIVCYLSDDQGKTWRASTTTLKSELLAQEPGVVELADGELLMFCRSRDCQLVSRSADGGDSWFPLVRSNIAQPTTSPASIERIPSTGHLLLVWNNGNDPLATVKPVGRRPLTAAISKDQGASWQHVQNIGTDPEGWYCYTAIEFVDDHVLLAHSEFPKLNSLQVTRMPVSWLYEANEAPQK